MSYRYIGPKEIAFIVVDASEYPPLPQNWESILRSKVFFDQATGGDLRSYIRTISYGRARITGDIYGPYRITLPRDSNNNVSYGSIIDLGIQAAKGQIEDYSYACVVATDNRLTDWAIYSNFPRGYFYKNPDSTITDACTVDLNAPLGVWAMEVLHMLTRFGDLYGIPDSPDGYDVMDCSCGTHPSAYTKIKFGWLESNSIRNVSSDNSLTTIRMDALANPLSAGGIRAITINIPESNRYLLVEARLPVDKYESGNPIFSSGLPDQGVVVYLIDESSWPPVHLLRAGMKAAGESFVDQNSGIKISIAQKLTSGFNIEIQRDISQECNSLKDSIDALELDIQDLEHDLEMEEDLARKQRLLRQIREKRSQLARLRTRAKILGCNV
jgi:hypothetical protein